jgi:polyisoprenoid-binding protein YceI
MIRLFLILLTVLTIPFAAFAAAWTVDPAHSEVGFDARHMVISKVHGQFKSYTADVSYDEKNPASLAFTVSIDAASIDTRVEQRNTHLKSPDFFDVAKYPQITFKSTKTEVVGPGKFKVTGDLTIRDQTKPVVLDVTGLDQVVEDGWGNYRAGAAVTGSINRHDFGLVWDNKMPAGELIVGEKVELNIQCEITRKKADTK